MKSKHEGLEQIFYPSQSDFQEAALSFSKKTLLAFDSVRVIAIHYSGLMCFFGGLSQLSSVDPCPENKYQTQAPR